jgi:hypothetical protein
LSWSSGAYTAHFLYLLFIFIVSIVVSNILIAFAVRVCLLLEEISREGE